MDIKLLNQNFELHPTGAMYWKEEDALLIADVHIGKVQHFRKSGIAVPVRKKLENFEKLDLLIKNYSPAKVYFLGDLFHSDKNIEWDYFFEWLKQNEQEFHLIIGNHDKTGLRSLPVSKLILHDELIIGDFLLTHEPTTRENFVNFCGHIHPGILLRGKGKSGMKIPCFAQQKNQLVLPAFGAFTGLYILTKKEYNHLYLTADEEVFQLK